MTTQHLFVTASLIMVALNLMSCDKNSNSISTQKVNCSNIDGLTAVTAAIINDAEKVVKKEANELSLSEIRASIDTLKLTVEDVRTSKQDPNSTKVYCEANVVLNIPLNTIEDANNALKTLGENKPLAVILEDYNLSPSKTAANNYEGNISYNLQPTDDNTKIYSQIDDGNQQLVWAIKDIVLLSLAKKTLNRTQAQQNAQDSTNRLANANTPTPTTPKNIAQSQLICSYRAKISTQDKFNSAGMPLAKGYTPSNAATILRQDRANFYKFGLADNEDTTDCLMNSKEQRQRLDILVANGNIDTNTITQIIDSNPVVRVDLYANHADISIID